jgi:hypothetical protein
MVVFTDIVRAPQIHHMCIFLFLVVTPCFPQFVKITGLAKNCGKLRNVNM